ncbi:NAD(P)H-binding protein [Ammonicoccus fulvus]|uniref:NAD(P)H-binding protein n=1 Tax=Ammonicoccus fulvus TaxID=3138240 RepID=A0ABZ3FM66_9ACTN
MKIAVLGGTGEMGSRVVANLTERGHEVVAASRANGVDVLTGEGLDEALAGVHTVVDCLNTRTVSKRRAVDFLTTCARNSIEAARRQEVRRAVVLSILNVVKPEVRAGLGYYAGKAAQEEAYAWSGLPATIVSTTAWFTLAEQFLTQARVGPFAFVPTMMLRPVHPDAAAVALADAAETRPAEDRVRLWGPEEIRADLMARDLARATGQKARVVGVPFPNSRFRNGALLPDGDGIEDDRRFADWLEEQKAVR